jgi:peptide/nickel transport system substrate-binding protein
MKRGLLLISVAALFLVFGFSGVSAETPRRGGTFNFVAPYGGDLVTLDGHQIRRTQDDIVMMQVNRGLYSWDALKKKPVLELADRVSISPDGLTYTFDIKKNVKFHNGRQMTVDDIVWSFNRIATLKPSPHGVRFMKDIKGMQECQDGKADSLAGVSKIDDYTLKIELVSRSDLAYALFWQTTCVLPKEEVARKDFTSNPIGLGPFKFVKWIKGSEVVLEKFDEFYKPGQPYLDKIVYKIMTEGAARDLAFRAKELDATLVGADQYLQYLKDPNIAPYMIEVAEMYTRHTGFNRQFKPFSDVRVRQAWNYAINSDLIIKKFVKGKAFPATGWLPTTSQAFDPNMKGYPYDPEKAKALMKEAGYEDGFKVKVMAVNNKSYGTGIVQAYLPMLKKIGIDVVIEQVEGAVMTEKVYTSNDYEAYMSSFNTGPDDFEVLFRWHSKNPHAAGNYFEYNNPEYDATLDKALVETDPDKKLALLRQAHQIFVDDAPVWFFNYNKAIIATQSWAHGFRPEPVEHMFQYMEHVWVEESSPRANMK